MGLVDGSNKHTQRFHSGDLGLCPVHPVCTNFLSSNSMRFNMVCIVWLI